MNLPPIVTRNAGLKVASLVIASLFWLYVDAGRFGQARFQVPVVLTGLPDDMAVSGEPPARVDVDMGGSRLALMALRPGSLRLTLDMSGLREGPVSFTNLEKLVSTANALQVTRVYPSRIELVLARKANQP
jgi:hypothetical protein